MSVSLYVSLYRQEFLLGYYSLVLALNEATLAAPLSPLSGFSGNWTQISTGHLWIRRTDAVLVNKQVPLALL